MQKTFLAYCYSDYFYEIKQLLDAGIKQGIMLLKRLVAIGFGLMASIVSLAQEEDAKEVLTKADTLRGSNNENRDWWDVMRYDITVKPDYATKTIEGLTKIVFASKIRAQSKKLKKGELPSKAILVSEDRLMQIDLQQPLIVDSITKTSYKNTTPLNTNGYSSNYVLVPYQEKISFRRDTNTIYIKMDGSDMTQYDNHTHLDSISIYYHGKPREAVKPPWDGGWVWTKDSLGNPWMSVACQGLGASCWYPCKDIQSDEPDSGACITIVIPDSLTAVANGREGFVNDNYDQKIKSWVVKNPINNYDIIPYIGKYVNFTDTMMGEGGKLDLSYWVLDYNLEKAKKQFTQVKPMLHCFEYWFGKYPFYEDSYKLVEAPYLGMEHQSAVAYGNGFDNGYKGHDLSSSGWGLKWDFIIIHESGHEWFGNSITSKDVADMWIHEGFTMYSEVLYTQWMFGKEAGNDYCVGLRKNIRNDKPIIGPYGVNKEGSGDMYYKGANMIHSIRHIINNDNLFRKILRGLNKEFYHQTVTTKQIEDYLIKTSRVDLRKVFDQYLRTNQVPELDYALNKQAGKVTLHWTNCLKGFDMPIVILNTGKRVEISTEPRTVKLSAEELDWFTKKNLEREYYIDTKQGKD